jgi:hypothetical protein
VDAIYTGFEGEVKRSYREIPAPITRDIGCCESDWAGNVPSALGNTILQSLVNSRFNANVIVAITFSWKATF